jgi:hypothetical protein
MTMLSAARSAWNPKMEANFMFLQRYLSMVDMEHVTRDGIHELCTYVPALHPRKVGVIHL